MGTTLCVDCGQRNEEGAFRCSNCNALLTVTDKPSTGESSTFDLTDMTGRSTVRVEVVDVAMPFWSMVVFMVKWAIASIPALIILFIIAAILMGIFGGYLGYSSRY